MSPKGVYPRTPRPVAERFWEKVQQSAGCWLWTGTRNTHGYGILSGRFRRSRKAMAHRLSYELNVGSISDGLLVLHRCDNPPCVRPDHLFLGTQADNVADMMAKGRAGSYLRPAGEASPSAKLTAEQVATIRHDRASGVKGTELARRFGVANQTIAAVWRGRTWPERSA